MHHLNQRGNYSPAFNHSRTITPGNVPLSSSNVRSSPAPNPANILPHQRQINYNAHTHITNSLLNQTPINKPPIPAPPRTPTMHPSQNPVFSSVLRTVSPQNVDNHPTEPNPMRPQGAQPPDFQMFKQGPAGSINSQPIISGHSIGPPTNTQLGMNETMNHRARQPMGPPTSVPSMGTGEPPNQMITSQHKNGPLGQIMPPDMMPSRRRHHASSEDPKQTIIMPQRPQSLPQMVPPNMPPGPMPGSHSLQPGPNGPSGFPMSNIRNGCSHMHLGNYVDNQPSSYSPQPGMTPRIMNREYVQPQYNAPRTQQISQWNKRKRGFDQLDHGMYPEDRSQIRLGHQVDGLSNCFPDIMADDDGQPSQSQIPSSSQLLQPSSHNMMLQMMQWFQENLKGVKRPAEQKSRDTKPKLTEEFKCIFKNCKKVLASKVNLFNHLRGPHAIPNPEILYGCTIDENIVDLDERSFQHKCVNCEFTTYNINDIDVHNVTVHGIVSSNTSSSYAICNKNKKNEVENDKEKLLEVVKSGKTKHDFKYRKRNNRAQRNARGHNAAFKARYLVKNKRVTENVRNPKDIPSETNILFICESCDIACESYDAAVQHSQNHITRPAATFVTETCDTCTFKFESVCYQKHLDRHYRDKELRKETFKTVNYNFNLLLSKDWTDSFDADVNIKKIEEQSIYASTRSVKMTVISESATTTKKFNLYQCWQCVTFIDPTSVTKHTLDYDSCLKIKHSFACNVCKRRFNTSYVRDKHEKVHKDYESFRIVVFNAKWDKEFNDILNNRESRIKTIYKCMCGLCFVSKRKSDDHTKACPGNETKQKCQKCNCLFNISELVSHLEHHLNGATCFKIEEFTSEPIVVDSDDDLESSNRIKELDTKCDISKFEVIHKEEDEEILQAVANILVEQTYTRADTIPGTSTANYYLHPEEIEKELCHDYESDSDS